MPTLLEVFPEWRLDLQGIALEEIFLVWKVRICFSVLRFISGKISEVVEKSRRVKSRKVAKFQTIYFMV